MIETESFLAGGLLEKKRNIKMEIRHIEADRAEQQRIFVSSEDGRFKYQVFMDYAKNLPSKYELVPYQGNVAGGCVDKKTDTLYCGLRGGGFMRNDPATCLIKLDTAGNYIGSIGEGILPGYIHFFELTDHNTICIATTNDNCLVEISMDGRKIVKTIGEKGKPCDNHRDMAKWETELLMHKGVIPTEPFHSHGFNAYTWGLNTMKGELGKPFHNPTDVSFDSKGNYYISDGYNNVAVHKFDADGKYVKTWGGTGVFDPYTDTPGKFLVPHSICVDSSDQVWVCDREKDAVHVFDTEGNVVAYFSHNLSQPSGVDTDGTYTYVAGRGGYITIFDKNCKIVGELGFFNGNFRAHSLAADSKGNLYLFPTHANYEHQIIALKKM